jgi:hypothetical protein
MKNAIRFAAAALAVASLSACATTLQATELNTEGRYTTDTKIDASKVTITKPFDAARHGARVLVADYRDDKTFSDFLVTSVKNTKKFGTVYTEAELEKYVIQNGVEGVTDTSSLLSLNKLAKATGPLLVIKPYVEYKGGYNFSASIEAIDAETTETVFTAKQDAFNWSGLDQPLFFPLFNSLIDWTEGKAPPPPAPKRN